MTMRQLAGFALALTPALAVLIIIYRQMSLRDRKIFLGASVGIVLCIGAGVWLITS